jgi:hypothetical protein
LWAFEVGKDIAGLDRNAKAELAALGVEWPSYVLNGEAALLLQAVTSSC